MRQIAKLAGVSPPAVSLALHNHPSISEATRQRIKAIAERIHYRPDPMLTRLAAYRRGLKSATSPVRLAYLINWPSQEQWRKEHYAIQFLAGARQRAEQLGYQLEEVWPRRSRMSARRLTTVLMTRNYDGLLVSDTPRARGHLTLDWSKFCAVKIGHSLFHPRLICVENDQYRIMQLAIRRLRQKGYRKIGLAMRANVDEQINHMYHAVYWVETNRPIFDPIPPLITDDWNEKTFRKWFLQHHPQVVLSPHLKVLRWLSLLGLRIPDEAGFVDMDCTDRSGARAGIWQHHQQVGATAVDTLVQLLQRNERGLPEVPQITLLEGAWIEGGTVRSQVKLNSLS